MKLPTIKTLSALVRAIKPSICDDYRETKDDLPSLCLTIGADGSGVDSWDYQTGDNSYSGGAYFYPHWAVVTVYRRSNSLEIAREIRAQLAELMIY